MKEEQEAQKKELQARIQEIRALYAKVQEATQGPATTDRKSAKAGSPWFRLQDWQPKGTASGRLRKIVVTSREGSSRVERSFFLQDDVLFFALYVTTQARKKDEERLYYDKHGAPIRWQHNKDIRPMDGHALRWGEQGWSDAKVALALLGDTASTARFEPITCVAGSTECRDMSPGNYCVTTYDLVPPPGLPVQKEICSSSPWFAGQGTRCSFLPEEEEKELTVIQHFQQSCSDDPECQSEGETSKDIPLTPEMGRVLECPLLNR